MKNPIFILAALMSCIPVTSHAQTQMPHIDLTAGFYRIDAEVAATPELRSQGLMHRKSMGVNQGMLFAFDHKDRYCMWMRNTLIPLSVAFLSEDGSIINIEDMQPQTENNHCASAPAAFALEMNLGWFAQKGLKPGAKINGISR